MTHVNTSQLCFVKIFKFLVFCQCHFFGIEEAESFSFSVLAIRLYNNNLIFNLVISATQFRFVQRETLSNDFSKNQNLVSHLSDSTRKVSFRMIFQQEGLPIWSDFSNAKNHEWCSSPWFRQENFFSISARNFFSPSRHWREFKGNGFHHPIHRTITPNRFQSSFPNWKSPTGVTPNHDIVFHLQKFFKLSTDSNPKIVF